MLTYITLFLSLCLAGAAAYFSIIGLTSIFIGAFWSIVVMATLLELCKLTTAAWLHLEWNKIVWWIKGYLGIALVVLMLITSGGIFGYLSKAHLEHTTVNEELIVQIDRVEEDIGINQDRLDRIDRQLGLFDKALDRYIDEGYVSRGLDKRKEQQEERTQLEEARAEISTKLQELQSQRSDLRKQNVVVEAEIGPLKYIAEIIYGDEARNHYSEAVRWIIMALVLVFDPLAVLLLVVSAKALRNDEVYFMNKKDHWFVRLFKSDLPDAEEVLELQGNDVEDDVAEEVDTAYPPETGKVLTNDKERKKQILPK